MATEKGYRFEFESDMKFIQMNIIGVNCLYKFCNMRYELSDINNTFRYCSNNLQ